jgi:hypothetical protein
VTQRSRHAAAAALGLVALLALVAVAATGAVPAAQGGSERPSEWALDVLASLVLVLLVPGSILLVFVVLLRPAEFFRGPQRRERKQGRAPSIVLLGLAVVLIVLAVRRLAGDGATGGDQTGAPGGGQGIAVPQRDDAYEPSFALVPVIVTVAVLLTGAIAVALALRSRRRGGVEQAEDVTVAVGEVLDEALDDLRDEQDARRAVIAAYARLERVLAAYGLPRRPSEAPEEYLRRVLPLLEVSRDAVALLTTLFETAKFSQHDVGATMKDEAIDALETARQELRLAAARQREAREQALALARERSTV